MVGLGLMRDVMRGWQLEFKRLFAQSSEAEDVLGSIVLIFLLQDSNWI